MARQLRRLALGVPLLAVAVILIAAQIASVAAPAPDLARCARPSPGRGEFGGDMAFLARCHAAPAAAGESNHFIDLWEETGFRGLVGGSGLTNNRALFVNSHGTALPVGKGRRYAMFPHESRVASGQVAPSFSVADLAALLGRETAAGIHNIIIGGCNEEGALRAQDFRAHFVNATNIIHMPAGEMGCQPMLLQALMTESENVQSIYESALRHAGNPRKWVTTTRKPQRSSVRFNPYVAELFRPGARAPFKVQVAGRELLDPTRALLPDLETLFNGQ